MEWETVLKRKAPWFKATRRERSKAALPTTIKHRDLELEDSEKKRVKGEGGKALHVGIKYKDVPLTEENYNLAPKSQKISYHDSMKIYYLIRGEKGDGAKAHFHREILDRMKVAGGPILDMKGNEILVG